MFPIAGYGMVIFSKVPNHIKAVVVDFVELVNKQANPIPIIIVETIRSLNFYRKKGECQCIGCVQLLYIWIRSHFWGKSTKPLKHFIGTFVPINEFLKKDWLMHQT